MLNLPSYLVPEAMIGIVHLVESKDMKESGELTSTNQPLDEMSIRVFYFRCQSGHRIYKTLSQSAKWARLTEFRGN